MFRTVSLFSGCGGLDLGFIKAGFDVIWAIDNDKYAVQTYKHNIGDHIIEGDVQKIDMNDLPKEFEVLIAGFPCQPFSMMGKELGFKDERGTLFFNIEKILKAKNPNIVVLENVKNLLTHDKGNTFKKMKFILEEKLGYKIYTHVLNTADYGVPQVRRRVFVVGFKDHSITLDNPPPTQELNITLQDILEKDVDEKYFLSEKIIPTIMSTGTKNYSAKPEIDLPIARPLCATMHKMHRASQDNYVTDNGRIRRLTPNECAKLQGFDPGSKSEGKFEQVVSDTQAYRQFGNAVTVDVAYYLARSIAEVVNKGDTNKLLASIEEEYINNEKVS